MMRRCHHLIGVAWIAVTLLSVSTWAAERMSSSTTEQTAEYVDPVLQTNGFVRSGLSWYRYEEESILVINLQPARYASGPYVNLGVYFLKFGHADQPDIVDCHVQTRLTRVVANAPREIELLDFSNEITADVRRDELREMVSAYGVPWLAGLARIEAAKSYFAGGSTVGHVAPIARADLLPPSSPH